MRQKKRRNLDDPRRRIDDPPVEGVEFGAYFADQINKAFEEYEALDKPKTFNTVEELLEDLDRDD
jgi:hypothetical protein